MNRCGSFPLHSVPHSLFSIWTNIKRSVKIPGALAWRWVEWIWLTGPSGLHRNSQQGLNISSIRVFDQIRDPEIPITLHDSDNIVTVILMTYYDNTEREECVEEQAACQICPSLRNIAIHHQNKGNDIPITVHEGLWGMWMQGSTYTEPQH